ncbi:uncharacterized protein L201_003917 [Kwoniella dendrophila CBS 6074]|uniref:Ubiquitin carboxyl-terminal hydrolase n=1 Tax=Kwoniella dendrophila CBS 6074 TaxID=1295534 RepID=A0AAX4JWS5_9TREE
MPPKKAPKPDWSWTETITSPDQITQEHQRRAAGLQGLVPCPFNFSLGGPSKYQDPDEEDDIIEIDRKGKAKANLYTKRVTGCTKKGCLKNPRCYNHLGAEEVVKPNAKEDYLDENAGIIPVEREGPAGLRNLGATCYANAFLQLWYHNVTFRNGVYDCVTTESTPLYHLAMVFGMLQYSNRDVVDPMGLIEALRLEKGNQQDAAEFSKLFMSVLASEFAKHPDDTMKTFLRDQFEGEMEYITRCPCGYASRTKNTFLELELNFKDKSTLEECITDLQATEILEGDNRYHCPACMKRQEATREQVPLKYPPVLHMALMRFVFDHKTLSRKKSPAAIIYPKKITLGGHRYELRAVITHEGKSAHHGHFICKVYDEAEQSWLLCNDEEVKTLSDRPVKKARTNYKLDGDTQTSKDAYMLVYKRRDQQDVAPREPPSVIWDKVIAHRVTLEEERMAIGIKREQLEDEFDQMNVLKKHVLRLLPGTQRIIPRDSLIRWLEATNFAELCGPFDPIPILCSHGGVDPDKTENVKLISEEAFEQIQLLNECPQLDICSMCVEDGFKNEIHQSDLQDQISAFDDANDGEGEYVISKVWLDQWRDGSLPPDITPSHEAFTLSCEHGNRSIVPKQQLKKKCSYITAEALAILKSIVGDFEAIDKNQEECEDCQALTGVNEEIRKARLDETKIDRQIKRQLNPKSNELAFGMDYYALSRRCVEEWEQYIKGERDRPELEMGLCQHGLLDYDPQMERPPILNSNGWNQLVTKYGNKPPVILQFGANPQPGKKTLVSEFRPGICEECCTQRRANFDEITIPVTRVTKPSINGSSSSSTKNPSDNGFPGFQNGFLRQTMITNGRLMNVNNTYTRSKANRFDIEAKRETSIKDIKVEIMNRTKGKLTPIQQKIYYKGRELASDETIGSLAFLLGDELELVEAVEIEAIDIDGDEDGDELALVASSRSRSNEGFGGTALLSRIACPDCTFENDGTAASCEMCMRPFIIDNS